MEVFELDKRKKMNIYAEVLELARSYTPQWNVGNSNYIASLASFAGANKRGGTGLNNSRLAGSSDFASVGVDNGNFVGLSNGSFGNSCITNLENCDIDGLTAYDLELLRAEVASDAGKVLVYAFAEMFEETLHRYNKIPYKNLIYFLNLLGADVQSGSAAQGTIAVTLNKGARESVDIPAGSSVYGQNSSDERVMFETQEALLAVDNEVENIFAKSEVQNKIIQCYDSEKQADGKSVVLFNFANGENLQQQKLYLAGGLELFLGENSKIIITVKNHIRPFAEEKLAAILADKTICKWQYMGILGECEFVEVNQVGNNIELILESDFIPSEIQGIEARWLICTIDTGVKVDLGFTHFYIKSEGCAMAANSMYANDLSLPVVEALPFGEQFNVYDDFYINCNAAFSKAGAVVKLNFDLGFMEVLNELNMEQLPVKWKHILKDEEVLGEKKEDIFVERVLWEYWNGNGWVRLFAGNQYEDFFNGVENESKVLRFVCPLDMDIAFVAADIGYFIRARIVKVNNLFQFSGNYHAPILKSLKIDFEYGDTDILVQQVLVEKDLDIIGYSGESSEEIFLYDASAGDEPCCYLQLKNPLVGGPIKLKFFMEKFLEQDLPNLKWQYFGGFAGLAQWKDLKVIDRSHNLMHSGIVTFIGAEDFKCQRLFGHEAYWLRLVNVDKKYDDFCVADEEFLPVMERILFNCVDVLQKETMTSQFFHIEKLEAGKECFLNEENVVQAAVWVNEVDSLVGEEKFAGAVDSLDLEVEYQRDAHGLYHEYFVKWREVKNFAESKGDDRVYILDSKNGVVTFGDGVRGKIPNSGIGETIRIDFAVSKGEEGNFEPYQIEGFASAVPYVEKVTNVEHIRGGCGREDLDEATRRGFAMIRHQNKAVSVEDFAVIAKGADRNIASVKTVVDKDAGTVGIVILPKVVGGKKEYFAKIKANVLAALAEVAPVTLVAGGKIDVVEVAYVEYSVVVNGVIKNYDYYQSCMREILRRLVEFLDPNSGNFNGNGFEIGQLPSKMKIYNRIKNIVGIKEISNIHIVCHLCFGGKREEIDYESALKIPYVVPISGKHNVYFDVE